MALAPGVATKGTSTGATSLVTGSVTTQVAGSLMITAELFQATSTFSSVVDSKSNAYTQLGTEQAFAAGNGKARLYYKENAVGGASHTSTFTNVGSAAMTDFLAEFTGVLTSGSLDGAVQQVNDAATPFTLAITPSAGPRLLVALFGGDSGSNPATHAESSGFTIIANANETNGVSFWVGCLAYKIVTGDGATAFTASFTETGGTSCGIILAAFKGSPDSMGARLGTGPGYGPSKRQKVVLGTRSFTSVSTIQNRTVTAAGGLTFGGLSAAIRGKLISAAGGLTFGGVATVLRGIVRAATGGLTFGGAATIVKTILKTATGGLTFGGIATAARGMLITATGGIVFGGTSPKGNGRTWLASGGLTFGGAATRLIGRVLTAAGGLTFDGAGTIVKTIFRTAAGGLTFGGAATVLRGLVRTASGGLTFGGVATVVKTILRTASGGLLFGGSSPMSGNSAGGGGTPAERARHWSIKSILPGGR